MIKFIIKTLALMSCSIAAHASGYPSKPITLIIGFPPGGGADNVARVYADNLGKLLDQPVIVENKPGAG